MDLQRCSMATKIVVVGWGMPSSFGLLFGQLRSKAKQTVMMRITETGRK